MKTKKPILRFISMLLLLAISWMTLSGSLHLCYGDFEEELAWEWSEEWVQGEGESSSEDTNRFLGSDGGKEDSESTRSLFPKENQPTFQPWQLGSFSSDLSLRHHYLAVVSSLRHKERERLSSLKTPLFILYCTYTSSLPVLA
ncbi:MAG: hypothetical protein HUU01_16945 [Saprospiraceae bacterium]|nr:hypothetical protein [Saprospiraceae bacterium]